MLGHKIALASIHVYSANKMVVPRSVDLKNPLTYSGALRTGSRASEAILWQNLNQLYDK